MEIIGSITPEVPLLVVAVHQEAEHLGTDLPILITGVGKLAASSSVMMAMAPLAPEARPEALINIGTAGALRDGIEGVHLVGSVHQHDLDGPAIKALTGAEPSPDLHLGEGVALATGDRFISEATERERLASRAHLVDMEGYAVAQAGAQLGIAVAMVKCVSDNADTTAALAWVDVVARCAMELGAWLSTNTVQGAHPRSK